MVCWKSKNRHVMEHLSTFSYIIFLFCFTPSKAAFFFSSTLKTYALSGSGSCTLSLSCGCVSGLARQTRSAGSSEEKDHCRMYSVTGAPLSHQGAVKFSEIMLDEMAVDEGFARERPGA